MEEENRKAKIRNEGRYNYDMPTHTHTHTRSLTCAALQVMMGVAAFTVSDKRMEAVNFTSAIDLQPYTFMIARPQELSRVMLFMEPFANDVSKHLPLIDSFHLLN